MNIFGGGFRSCPKADDRTSSIFIDTMQPEIIFGLPLPLGPHSIRQLSSDRSNDKETGEGDDNSGCAQ